jgi:alpha-mannosidase
MKKVTAYVHSHWDREWYREFEDFRLRLIEVFDEILSDLKSGELPYFYFDGQTSALEDYLEIHSEKLPLIKELIKEKKLRTGPFYCSIDSFLSSGETFYRNLELGLKTAKEFGETDFIAYLADTFGHSHCIPMILKPFNINKACLWRGLGNLPADLKWDGIDVTYLIQGYFQDFLNSGLPARQKAENLKKYLDKIALKSSDNVLLPIGGDHLAPPKDVKKQIEKLNKIYKDYKIEIGTPFDYFGKIKKRKEVSGEFLDNSLNFILPGVYSSRIYLKQENAKAQWLLSRIAEPLQAISHYCFGTKNKQNEIDYAYKTLIKNQAHDSIYGCSIDSVHKEVTARFEKVNAVSNGIIKRTIRDLSDKNSPLAVINLSDFKYSGKVFVETEKKLPSWMNAVKVSSYKGFTDSKLYNTNEVPVTEDIANINTYLIDVKNLDKFSLTKLTEKHINKENNLKITKNSVENKNIKLEIKNGKVNITDKKHNKTFNDFIIFTDRADIGDSYNFGGLKKDKPLKSKITSFKIKEQNKIRAVLNIVFELEIPLNSTEKGRSKSKTKCKISTDFILYNQSELMEIKGEWINKCKNHILQISFNLPDKIKQTVSEDLYGTVKRKFNPDYDIYKDIPAPRGIELKPNTAPMQRFVIAQDFALFTKGNIEYEIIKNTLNLTLLRATGIISNPKNPTRGTPAGPPLETPDLQCLGENCFDIAFAFENKEQNLFKLAEEFYAPLIVLFTNKPDMEFFEIDKNSLVYSVTLNKENMCIRTFDFKQKCINNVVIKR